MATGNNIFEKRLRKLPVEYLWDGLVLKEDIYNHSGTVLLIPKGEMITEKKLNRLLKFQNDNKNIMVGEEIYYQILVEKNIPPEIRQKITENNVGYTELKQNIGGMLHNAAQGEWFESNLLEPVIEEISEKLADIDPALVFSCINFTRPMDEGLQRHSLNVAFLNGMMGDWLELPKQDVKKLVMAGILHDVGKTKIPEDILNAPRKLTKEEREIIQRHPVYSYEMLSTGFDERVRLAARHHHEKLNGKGYPDKISGEDVSLFARITAISDIYDAMIAKRSYKEAKLPFIVFDMFYRGEYDGLDMDLVMIFLKNMRKNLLDKKVLMSDGEIGVIRYIPPNDSDCPIVQCKNVIKQTDEEWFCTELISAY